MITKTNLIKAIQEKTNCSVSAVNSILDAATEFITQRVADGETVSIKNFGTFSARNRAERSGRNPRTGESIIIEARKVAIFKPGKAFKEIVNK